jgi:hypothetical protein
MVDDAEVAVAVGDLTDGFRVGGGGGGAHVVTRGEGWWRKDRVSAVKAGIVQCE